MHADIHLRMHELRSTELRHEAAAAALLPHRSSEARAARAAHAVRAQVGWALVELGLRLAAPQPRTVHPTAV
ncbi:hypothetical protein [Streptomyces purpureus]|uniref:Uncharacterized protein n=1 Tax=Streptomyces purpureus TaxID=1951 RepID=A0A918GZP6_9ACTN|nr:hypothetical protein [Streptomyces purpureus]GGT27531.1 hypothetical protein GCM10014713_21050 [Streptomyces purpureus]